MLTQKVQTHNLPLQPTPFIGRADDIAEISTLLGDDTCSLLTLLGPGGIGKTRLAIEVASRILDAFPDGVYFVALDPLDSLDFLVPTIADAIGIRLHNDESPQNQFVNYLRDKELMLILDSFEHLMEGVVLLAEILHATLRVKLLVTSREVLNVQGEWVRQVRGMPFPTEAQMQSTEAYDAVQLLVERAHRVRRNFSLEQDELHVVRICQLVEGMPLALELAASWLRTLSSAEIVAEIQHNIDFLATNVRNVPVRHRSIQAVFVHSWKLLMKDEREVFKKLSVFRGSFSRAAAADVADASLLTLSALVDKSFIRVNTAGRYSIHELLRQYAIEQFEEISDEYEEIQTQHAIYYADFLYQREDSLKGSGQIAVLDEIEAELENIRVAWQWMLKQKHESAIHQSMEGLVLFYSMRSKHMEGYLAFSTAVKHFEKEADVPLGYLLTLYGWFCLQAGEVSPDEGYAIIQQGVALLKSLRVQKMPVLPLMRLSFHVREGGEIASLRQLYQENLAYFRQHNDHWGESWSLRCLGMLAYATDQNQEALPYFHKSLEISREISDGWGASWSLGPLGLIAEQKQHYVKAQEFYRERFSNVQAVGDLSGVAWTHSRLLVIAYNLRDMDRFKYHLSQVLQIAIQSSEKFWLGWSLYAGVLMFATEGRKRRAHTLLTQVAGDIPSESWEDYAFRLSKDLSSHLESPMITRMTREQVEELNLKQVATALLAELSPHLPQLDRSAHQTSDQPLIDPLSKRELEVLLLIAEGLTNQEIADRLYIVKGTVKAHINAIYRKLDVRNRVEAIKKARELEMI